MKRIATIPALLLLVALSAPVAGRMAAAAESRSISGVVYIDRNLNGQRDAGERGAPGRTVEVQDSTEGTVRTARSGEDGRYHIAGFSGQGAYLIYLVTDEEAPCGDRSMRPLAPDDDWSHIDIAVVEGEREISGAVVDDANESGLRDAGEPGREGWTVLLQGVAEEGAADCGVTVTSGADGRFRFRNLPEGSYYLLADPPEESASMLWEFTYPTLPDQTYPQLRSIVCDVQLLGEVTSAYHEFGVHELRGQGTISASTFIDKNTNEVRDRGEPLAECWRTEGIDLYRSLEGIGLLPVMISWNPPCEEGVSSLSGLPGGVYGLWYPWWCSNPEQAGPPSNPDEPTTIMVDLKQGGRVSVEHGGCPWDWVEIMTPTPPAAPASTMPTGVVAAPNVGEGTADAGRPNGWRAAVTLAILGAAVCGATLLRTRRQPRDA